MKRTLTYLLHGIILMALLSAQNVSAQSKKEMEYASIGKHRIAYHFGYMIAEKEQDNTVMKLLRKRALPMVSIDYSFFLNRHWSVGIDAVVYIPNKYDIRIPGGTEMLEGEDSNKNMTAGGMFLTGGYTHQVGPVELSYILGVGFTEFTTKTDDFYIMNTSANDLYTLRLKGESGYAFTLAPQIRVTRHLSHVVSIFFDARYNILSKNKTTMSLKYAPNVVDRDHSPMNEQRFKVGLPNFFNLNIGFALRFGKL